jgi:hypothetical protein
MQIHNHYSLIYSLLFVLLGVAAAAALRRVLRAAVSAFRVRGAQADPRPQPGRPCLALLATPGVGYEQVARNPWGSLFLPPPTPTPLPGRVIACSE